MKLTRLLSNPPFLRVRRKYYAADEVDDWLHRLREEAEAVEQRQAELEERLRAKAKQEKATEPPLVIPDVSLMVRQATDRANEIMSRTMTEREYMLASAQEQQSRAKAASRAVYYSALQFKQDLAKQYRDMEKDLNDALDSLCKLDTSAPFVEHEELYLTESDEHGA